MMNSCRNCAYVTWDKDKKLSCKIGENVEVENLITETKCNYWNENTGMTKDYFLRLQKPTNVID